MSLEESLGRVVLRHEELAARLAGESGGGEEFVAMSREYAELSPVVAAIEALRAAESELVALDEMIAADDDAKMRELAQAERDALQERLPDLEHAMKLLLIPKDDADRRNAILEIRAGTGGHEAALFAADLLRMYRRYAETHRWRVELIDMSENDIGGIKEAQVLISGQDVFSRLKYESGVHRVQRVPVTESSGRIHTSAATVAVLPEAEEVDVRIDDKDLRIDTFRASGAGGQHVNKTDSAVRITHLPSGIVVSQQDEKSQHKNRAKAMKILLSRLYDEERRKLDGERAESRKSQVGSGDRSERIRTYNFPQGRLTDHRINLTLYKLDAIVAGDALDDVIAPLIAEDQAARLADLD
ncbi:MAG: peptide chain release factor 1 [Rhodospirillales bacterium]|nr:peptide chain release factor 1 [Rhodospirillales bacterium]